MQTLVLFHLKPDCTPVGSRQVVKHNLVVFYPQ